LNDEVKRRFYKNWFKSKKKAFTKYAKNYTSGAVDTVIASWIAPYSGNPALILIHQLLEPVQSLFRKVIPPIGGLDLSPIFIFLGIQVLEIMLVGTLRQGLGLGGQAAMFVIGI